MCSEKSEYGKFPHVLVLLTVLQLLITCPGCSVKEDRDLCPCTLEIDASGDGHAADSISITLAGSAGKAAGFVLEDKMGERWRGAVPRGEMYLAAVYPAGTVTSPCLPDGRWLKIDAGRECPRIWMSCCGVSTMAEHVEVPLALHKSYCELTMFIRDVSGGRFPYRLEIRGDVDGYMADGRPSEGKFIAPVAYVGEASSSGVLEARVALPRQTDNSLLLDIISDDDRFRTFAVGNYIEASGYDWTSPDLKDITLEIDYARTDISFRIASWRLTAQFETVI